MCVWVERGESIGLAIIVAVVARKEWGCLWYVGRMILDREVMPVTRANNED